VDLEAAAARLREAMARGTQAAQQARAQEENGAGQSCAEAAAQAADAEEAGQGGGGGAAQAVIEVEAGQVDAASAARPETEGETGGGTQEHPAGQAEEDTLVHEPPRAESEGVAEEEVVQEAPVVGGDPISEPTEARDEGTVAVVPAPTAQGSVAVVVELPESSEEYGDSMDIDPAAAASAAAHIAEFASASPVP
jgi:hypothetical protein